ncbi:MAG: response regulator transcription factor [Verrucomicrobiae bacterium]|nr:response regulator transcription factor [Verrucomicrobiae bacterium]
MKPARSNTARQKKIRIAIVEDNADLRQELASQLGREPDLSVVGGFGDAESAAAALPGLEAQVVLTDIHLPGKSGIELVRKLAIQEIGAEFLMLTAFDDDDLIFDAIRVGAVGYLLKRDPSADIADAIRLVKGGGSPMSGSIARKLLKEFARKPSKELASLSPQEYKVLERLARGRTYKECGTDLAICEDTVRSHIRSIYKKLHVHTRHEAVAKFHGF